MIIRLARGKITIAVTGGLPYGPRYDCSGRCFRRSKEIFIRRQCSLGAVSFCEVGKMNVVELKLEHETVLVPLIDSTLHVNQRSRFFLRSVNGLEYVPDFTDA
jgi:hypothetical protein